MTDPLAPGDGLPGDDLRGEDLRDGEANRCTEPADNVFELRRRVSTGPALGHPSGPRSGPSRASSGSASSSTVDAALSALRAGPAATDALRRVRGARPDPSHRLRVALGALATVQLTIAGAWLVGKVPFGQLMGSPTAAHLSRDAALGVVLGSIGAVVSWRPRWSLSLVPIVGAIVAVQAIGLAADGSNEQSGFHFELPHVLAIVVGTLIFVVSRRRTKFAHT